jgi:hypothetical protein
MWFRPLVTPYGLLFLSDGRDQAREELSHAWEEGPHGLDGQPHGLDGRLQALAPWSHALDESVVSRKLTPVILMGGRGSCRAASAMIRLDNSGARAGSAGASRTLD